MNNQCLLPKILILLLLVSASCYRAPEFPVEPSISFESLRFYDTPNQDSLVLAINFEDGDGDLGISGNEIDQPYHPFSFVFHNGNPLTISSNDTMPPFFPPYSCENYKIGKVHQNQFIYYVINRDSENPSFYQQTFGNTPPDTLYAKPNIFTDNFLVDFYVQRNGVYEEFDWVTAPSPNCGESFNGRFTPIFDTENPDKPLSGQIFYAMENFGFLPYFRNDTVKLSVRIIDRALHVSNRIETPGFYFVRGESNSYQIQLLD